MSEALVFNIQGFSIQDGPGVRTTVFLKGCPLHCLWCANPESQEFRADVIHSPTKCVRCFRCVKGCPEGAITMPAIIHEKANPVIDHSKCYTCKHQACTHACYESALTSVAKVMDVEDVMKRLRSDAPFFRQSGGGVTVSGGECLCHPEFVAELFEECKDEMIHTCIETCGYCEWERFKKVLRYTDMVLYDLKHMDTEVHKQLTGVGNELILENFKKVIAETRCTVIARIPCVPGYNDSIENLEATAKFIKEAGGNKVHLLAYHRLGVGKYEGLGRDYLIDGDLATPSDEHMQSLKAVFDRNGIACFIGGNSGY